jgi:CHAD domain-containing protein
MTTDRTAIRRRLAVRGTAHRPPWGGRKSGHHNILAPRGSSVAGALAATVAVGVGVALARAERERRAARQRRRAERQFALLPREPPVEGLRRMALGQLDTAIELLDRRGASPPDEKAVHETRKALKRLRALVRMLRRQLGEPAFARESAALRDAGRRLARTRDTEVLVATLDALLKRHPRRLGRRRGLARLREALVAEREAAAARALGDVAMRAEVLDELRAIRRRVSGWPLGGHGDIDALEKGLARIYRQGRKRYRRAASGKGNRGRALHEWRKRVKDLRYAAEMLDLRVPSERLVAGHGSRRHGRGRRHAEARLVRRLARRADGLGEMLGEEHDLALLADRIRAQGGRGGGGGQARLSRRNRKVLLTLIARRRRKLRAQTLGEGARLYRRGPKKFVRRVRRAYRRARVSRR